MLLWAVGGFCKKWSVFRYSSVSPINVACFLWAQNKLENLQEIDAAQILSTEKVWKLAGDWFNKDCGVSMISTISERFNISMITVLVNSVNFNCMDSVNLTDFVNWVDSVNWIMHFSIFAQRPHNQRSYEGGRVNHCVQTYRCLHTQTKTNFPDRQDL